MFCPIKYLPARPHGLCRVKQLSIVSREGAAQSKKIGRKLESDTIGV